MNDANEMERVAASIEPSRIAVAATFVAEGIAASLDYCLRQCDLARPIVFAPFNQVIQHLLDSGGVFDQRSLVGIILLQIQHWVGDGGGPESRAAQFLEAMNVARCRAPGTHFLVVLCPPSLTATDALQATEARLQGVLSAIPGVTVVTHGEIATAYPEEAADCYDAYADEVASIPYTELYQATLGTMLARKIRLLQAKPCKVLVIDCDHTLWHGIVGELGTPYVIVTPAHRHFQRFLLDQSQQGRLLCLCSKNNEADVFAVLDHHPEMLLRRENITAWRINWEPKPENLKSLGRELGLATDSFVFIDDDDHECERMRSFCPEVTTLQFPKDEQAIQRFVRDTWEFDIGATTTEDIKRVQFYREDLGRKKLRQETLSLEAFISSLNLNVTFSLPDASLVPRLAQLSARSNQFNLNGDVYSESRFHALLPSDNFCVRSIHVADRFGDYGMVGFFIARREPQRLAVEALCLSCRVLGRGVETRVTSEFRALRHAEQVAEIVFLHRDTGRNQPLRSFLESECRISSSGDYLLAASKSSDTAPLP